MKYTILTATVPTTLTPRVNEFIQKGWIPSGGVTATFDGGYSRTIVFAQAMIHQSTT